MYLNHKQKRKLAAGLILTLLILFAFPQMGLNLSEVSKIVSLLFLWLLVAVSIWYRRDRF